MFPILIDDRSGVFEPAFPYFREQAILLRLAPGSLGDAARILCIWVNWLKERHRAWDEPCPNLFLKWAMSESRGLSIERQRRRATVVFGFYEYCTREAAACWQIQSFVDELSAPIPAYALAEGRRVTRTSRLKFRGATQAMRPTPSPENVETVAAALLGTGSTYAQVRNWLIVQTALATNLRIQGLSKLTIGHIDAMLRDEGMLGTADSIQFIATDGAARSRLRRLIDDFEFDGRSYFLSTLIEEKGKRRTVRFPVMLMRQILEFVWNEHSAVSRNSRRSGTFLWISMKTSGALKRGSIGDILKEGFVLAGTAGSGHRIRATHCITLFRDYVAEAHKNGGTHMDAAAILERVAQIMGHNHPESLRPYLNLVLLEKLVSYSD